MVGCTAKFNFRSARNKLVLRKKICPEKIKANKVAFQLELKNRFEVLDISDSAGSTEVLSSLLPTTDLLLLH